MATSISCGTITACYAEATTITSTLTDEIIMTTTPFVAYAYKTDSAYFASIATKIDVYFSSMDALYSSADASTTTSSTTSTTSKTSTTSSKTSTSTGPSETSLDNLCLEEVTYSYKGSSRCKIFSHLYSFYEVAKSYIRGDDIYGTLSTDENRTRECYIDGKNAGFRCGVFVKGIGCQLLSITM
ncbi:hypothetical protein N7495_005170 [Penicillium taxi]|uniref:uncharacterized protein n=1 Tax=Penicillium taxi TaxID=168475 RepID=UPI00254597C2|nr:uncharacterized protein N7495_005170 [Penicillium taxi]KAJ5893479.1 hypothetical protein N7495_005170 [Penicillium taxi]